MKKACAVYERAVDLLSEKFLLEDPEDVRRLTRVLVGVALRYVHQNIIADVGDERLSIAIKGEIAQAAGIGSSTVDSYIGQAFKNCSAFQDDKLASLFNNIFYGDAGLTKSYRYLKQSHVGFLCSQYKNKNEKYFFDGFLNLIRFIESKPHLIDEIKDKSDERYLNFLQKVFHNLDNVGCSSIEGSSFRDRTLKKRLSMEAVKGAIVSDKALLISAFTFFLGLCIPVSIFFDQGVNKNNIHFLIHDPGKMIFHLILFPGALYVFLSNVKIKEFITRKGFFLLIVGLLAASYQTYLQDIQMHCHDSGESMKSCVHLVVLKNELSMGIYTGLSFFLSTIGAWFACLVVYSHITVLLDRNKLSSELILGQLVANMCFLIWLILRNHSEWHFSIHPWGSLHPESGAELHAERYYPSFIVSITLIVFTQIIILWQSFMIPSRMFKHATLPVALVMILLDGIAVYLSTHAGLSIYLHTNVSYLELLNYFIICGILWYSMCVVFVRSRKQWFTTA